MEAKSLIYLREAKGVRAQDCDDERDEFGDGEIVISVNCHRPEAPVWWRWEDEDDWRHLPIQSADLPLSNESRLAIVRLHADIDDTD